MKKLLLAAATVSLLSFKAEAASKPKLGISLGLGLERTDNVENVFKDYAYSSLENYPLLCLKSGLEWSFKNWGIEAGIKSLGFSAKLEEISGSRYYTDFGYYAYVGVFGKLSAKSNYLKLGVDENIKIKEYLSVDDDFYKSDLLEGSVFNGFIDYGRKLSESTALELEAFFTLGNISVYPSTQSNGFILSLVHTFN